MIYKFFIGKSTIIICDCVKYRIMKLKDMTFKDLNLYAEGIRIGSILIDEDTKIKYNEEKSSKKKKIYFVD